MAVRPLPFSAPLPLGRDPVSVRRRVEAMEHLLEGLVTIPGIKRRVGLDAMLDALPVAGSTIGAVLGAYLVWEARNLGMSKGQVARMVGNVGVDWALGLVPWLGAIPDFFFRSNSRNLRIIRRHLDRNYPQSVTVDR